MNLLESIQRIIRKAAAESPEAMKGLETSETSPATSQNSERFRSIMEGMGTGTARIVIDKEATQKITEEYKVKGLANRGRYYVAKVVRPDGSVIDELLVDKQTGNVQFLARRS